MKVSILNFNPRTEVAKVRIGGHKVLTISPGEWRGLRWRTYEEREELIKAAAVKRHNRITGVGVVTTTQTAR